MGVALFIVLEREIPDFDLAVNGKALAHAEDQLSRLAGQLGVTPLMNFFSIAPEDAQSFIESEGGDPEEVELPDEAWFPAADGLATVNAMLEHISRNLAEIPDADAVLRDLQEFQSVLQRAAEKCVRWHLAVDV